MSLSWLWAIVGLCPHALYFVGATAPTAPPGSATYGSSLYFCTSALFSSVPSPLIIRSKMWYSWKTNYSFRTMNILFGILLVLEAMAKHWNLWLLRHRIKCSNSHDMWHKLIYSGSDKSLPLSSCGLLMTKSTEIEIWEWVCWGNGCWTSPLYEAEECAFSKFTSKW